MHELKLSDDLNVITAEINSYKQVAGQAIFEIGARLKHVKENDLAHGEFGIWLENIEMDRSIAAKYMKVFEQIGSENVSTYTHLGLNALHQIATLPEPEREKKHEIPSTGETKTVDEMTVRELREVKRELKLAQEETEQARRSESIAIRKLESMEESPAEVVEIVKEIPPADYDQIKGGYSALQKSEQFYKEQNNDLRNEINQLEARIKNTGKEIDTQKLESQKEILEQRIKSTNRIFELHEKAEDLIHYFSPLKYSDDFVKIQSNRELMNLLETTVDGIARWCSEIKEEMPNKNIIEGSFIND